VLATKYPKLAVVCVPNGVDQECLPPRAPDPYPGLSVVYAGTLYANRDLAPVMHALRVFVKRHPDAARDGAILRVAGPSERRHARAFDEEIVAAGLGHCVDVLGLLPRASALNVVSRSRLAVVLAQRQELQIPSKLYESVAMGVPTLVVAEGGSAAAVEGKRVGAVVRDPRDVEGIASVLEQLWRDGSGQRSPCPVPITYEALAPLMDKVLRGNGAPITPCG